MCYRKSKILLPFSCLLLSFSIFAETETGGGPGVVNPPEDDDPPVTTRSHCDSVAVDLYSENNLGGELICTLAGPGTYSFVEHTPSDAPSTCHRDEIFSDNDKARSMRIRGATAGCEITIYDSIVVDGQTIGRLDDDWTEVRLMKDAPNTLSSISIGSFQSNDETEDYRMIFHRDDTGENALDGEVSLVTIDDTDAPPTVDFYLRQEADYKLVCSIIGNSTGAATVVRFKEDLYEWCGNDEAKSAVFYDIPPNYRIEVYDDTDNVNANDDFQILQANPGHQVRRYIIHTFESNFIDNDMAGDYCCGGNLDEAVSSVIMRPQ